jgi:hypothetical protein
VIASILVLIWALWMLVCLRTIAINSSSTLRQTNNTRLHL